MSRWNPGETRALLVGGWLEGVLARKDRVLVCALFSVLVVGVGALPVASSAKVFIGKTESITIKGIETAGVDVESPDTPSSSLSVDSGGGYVFVKIDLSEVPPIDEIFLISASISFDIGGWHGAGAGGYASVCAHYCEDDSWSPSTLTWNNKPEHREKVTDSWGFAIIHFGDTLGFDLEADVEETLRRGDKILTEVITWGSGSGSTTLSEPEVRVRYVRGEVCKVLVDADCDEPGLVAGMDTPNLFLSDTPLTFGIEAYAHPGEHPLELRVRCKFLGWRTSGGVSVLDPGMRATQLAIDSDGSLTAVCSSDWVLYGSEVDAPSPSDDGLSFDAAEGYAIGYEALAPGYLRLVRIYVLRNPAPFELHVMGGAREVWEMPDVLREIADPLRITPSGAGWVEVDMTPQGVKLETGDEVFFSVAWTQSNAPVLGTSLFGQEDVYRFTEGGWEHYYDHLLIQFIVTKTLEEPASFEAVTVTTTAPPPSRTGIPTEVIETTVTAFTPGGTTTTGQPPPAEPGNGFLAVSLGILVLLVVGAALLYRRRKRPPPVPPPAAAPPI